MAFVLANNVRVATATTGTGTVTLGSAVAGFQTFAEGGISDGDTTRYRISDGDAWEIGTGTYTATGTTMARSVEESSNSDAALNLTGNATVEIVAAVADIVPANKSVLDGTTASFTTTDETKLDGIEAGATADQSNAEIETAYNTQVPLVGQAEAEAGTSTTRRGWNALRVAQAIAALAGGGGGINSVSVQTFTSSGTWTKPTGFQFGLVIATGGGGGGDSGGSGDTATGGAAGGTAIKLFTNASLASSESVTVGAGGAANGSAGGNTTFDVVTANGGAAGNDSSTNVLISGRVGGTATGGDLNIQGGGSEAGHVAADTQLYSKGGDSFWGGSGPSGSSTASGAYGTGGTGSGDSTIDASGIGGVVFVLEFKIL